MTYNLFKNTMKLKKSIVIPSLVLIFALMGLELQVLPYVPFGSGRWIDSVSKNTSNRSIEVRGNVNITGNYYKNGVLFSGGGGTPITGSDENAGILDEVTGLDFVGNIFTATGDTGTGLLTLTSTVDTNDFFTRFNLDTTKIGHLSENNTWTGSNTFSAGTQTIDALYVTSSIVNDGLTQTDTLSVIQGANFGGAISVAGTVTANSNANITGFTQLGNSPGVKIKIVNGVMPNTAAAMNSYAHGITYGNSKIVGWTVTARSDSTGAIATITGANDMFVYPGYSQIAQLNYSATVDSLFCNVRTLGTTNTASLFGDSVRFVLIYIQ